MSRKEFADSTIRFSIVSHEQDELVNQLLRSITSSCNVSSLYATIVRNTSSPSRITKQAFPFEITVIQNDKQKGFGENHNQAFTTCREEFFCVLNPDILIKSDIFDQLKENLQNPLVGVAAPLLTNSEGKVQDNARAYPTPWRIFKKILFPMNHSSIHYPKDRRFFPDWVAGMFMLFPSHVFQDIGGFDEKYFLYYEDADICMRLLQKGYKSQLDYRIHAIHDARRASHQSLRYLSWHLSSMTRFFIRYPFYKL